MATFSCDEGYLFPLPLMVQQVRRKNPDMLFFAGDQLYKATGDFKPARFLATKVMMLDFLRCAYLFGWTWRTVMRDRPSVILPDDHDVFQGNLCGHGGRALPNRHTMRWVRGGYVMPGAWVTAVERVFTGHF